MPRTIRMSKKAPKAELKGNKAKVVSALSKLGAVSDPVEFTKLKKACKSIDPRALRMHIRQLAEDKLVTVNHEKAA